MTQPNDPRKSSRLGQISFFQICKWITDHMVEIVPGKTHAELCQFLNEVEDLEPIMPNGGLGIHSIPAIIRATEYVPAAPGARSKVERTKITKTQFNELKREVTKLRQQALNTADNLEISQAKYQKLTDLTMPADFAYLKNKIEANAESLNRLITVVQEIRPQSASFEEWLEEHAEVDRVEEVMSEFRDDNDAQLDDIYPEDAPHQSEYQKYIEKHHYDEEDSHLVEAAEEIAEQEAREEAFKGLEPSPEIQAIIAQGNITTDKEITFPEDD